MQPFADWGLWDVTGWPMMTIVRDEVVMERGRILGEEGYGRYLPRYPNNNSGARP
jgi:hypothetical protein